MKKALFITLLLSFAVFNFTNAQDREMPDLPVLKITKFSDYQ